MNPLTFTPSITSAAISVAILAGVVGGSALAGYVHGMHKAELACANANTAAMAGALKKWESASAAQLGADRAARLEDQKRSAAAADQAQAVADRFASMRLAIVKLPPAAACKLSPEWVAAFNGAR